MRMTSKGPDRYESNRYRIEITGTKEEIEALEAMMAGGCYVGCGRENIPLRVETFSPVDIRPDPATAKHFAPVGPDGKSQIAAYWQSPFEFEKGPFGLKCEPQVAEHLKPQEWCVSVYVHGIAGYCAEKEVVAERQAALLSWGFEIMRSPRGEDGRYWEVFYLPGVWKLQGDMKGRNLTQTLKAVASLGVGSIDLVTQRAALSVDD